MVVGDRELDAGDLPAILAETARCPSALPRCSAAAQRLRGGDPIATILARVDALAARKAVTPSMAQGTWHFVGIGGIGMSAIARILLARGESVSGSDVKATPLIEQLRARRRARRDRSRRAQHRGRAHRGRQFRDRSAQSGIRGRAARRHRRCCIAARCSLGSSQGRRGIAICGTHGKTTTTAMTHRGAALGRRSTRASCSAESTVCWRRTRTTGTSPWFVTEADESDGSFALLAPAIAVVTNIENDHLASDDELPQLVRAFDEFLAKLPDDGVAIVGVDNPLAGVARPTRTPRANRDVRNRPRADVRARTSASTDLGSTFRRRSSATRVWAAVELRVPGAINVQNALAAIAVARELEIPFVRIAAALARLSRRPPPLRYSGAQRTDRRSSTTTRIIRPPCARRSRRRANTIPGRSLWPFSRTAIRARRFWRATSPTRCAARIASISRRSTPPPSRRFPA